MIIAFHGLQGSGKTSLSTRIHSRLKARDINCELYGIKSTFTHLIEPILTKLGIPANDLLAKKELQKAVSVWGEKFIDKDIWSNQFKMGVMTEYSNKCVLMDDCRTSMNLEALKQIAESGRKVFLFRLMCSDEIRKQRCSAWREEDCYTEKLLEKPLELPSNFVWVDLDTEAESSENNLSKIMEVVINGNGNC